MQPSRGYRYERKFRVDQLDIHQVRAILKMHPALFSEVYPPRYVNNLYFDTVLRTNYWDNFLGAPDRVKVRIRWYGDLFGEIDRPVLEYKIKRGTVGTKLNYPLPLFCMDEHFSEANLRAIIYDCGCLPEIVASELASLRAAVLNRYHRAYFATPDRRFRVTLDSQLTFYQVRQLVKTFMHQQRDREHIIVELKYDLEDDPEANRIASQFPFRATRSSKYVEGVARLGL